MDPLSASLEDEVAARQMAVARRRGSGQTALRGLPTTTPRGWTQGTKTGWKGGTMPPGLAKKMNPTTPATTPNGMGKVPNFANMGAKPVNGNIPTPGGQANASIRAAGTFRT